MVLGSGGWGILVPVLGRVGSKRMIFAWILGLCSDILVAGYCLKPFPDAPWLEAGWLAEGPGSPGEAQDGSGPSDGASCVWLGGSSRGQN